MTRINLNFKTLDGQSHGMESVDDSQTVSQFKVEVGRMLGLDPGTLRMIFSGRVLQDEKPLSEFDLNNKTVHVVQRAPPPSHRPNIPQPTPSVAQPPPPPERRFPFPTIEVLMPLRALENPLRAFDLSRATGRLYHAGSMLNRAKRIISELENQSRGGAARNEPSSANGQPRETDGSNVLNGDQSTFPRNVRRFAALMREYRETYSRLVPFLEEVENALETPNRTSAQQNQALFDEVTEAMHLLSHVLHALSDSSIDFREDGPLYVRSRSGGSEVADSIQSSGVSLRVRAPRSTLASVTPGTSRNVNLMLSGDWQPRVSTSTTQSTTSTPNVSSSSSNIATGSIPAPPTTSASGAPITPAAMTAAMAAAANASTGSNQMMSLFDFVVGVTPLQSGASVGGDGASISFSTSEIQSAVHQVIMGEARAMSAARSVDSNNDRVIRVLASTVTPNTPTAQAAAPSRPNPQPDDLPTFFDDLRTAIQSFVSPTSTDASPPAPAPTTSSSAQNPGSATTSSTPNTRSATSGNQSSASTTPTATPILITAEAETMGRPGFSDPRLHRFSHRGHQTQRSFERDPFLVCGSWRVPAGSASEPRTEGQAQTTERQSPTTASQSTPPTTATQTPRSDSSRATSEPQFARPEGDQHNNFGQRLLPVIMQFFQEGRNALSGSSGPQFQNLSQPEMGTTGPQPSNLILANLMGLDNSDHPSLMQEIVTTMAQHMTVTDIVNGIIGDTSFLSRLQRPLTEVVRRRVLLEGRLSVEEGVQRFIDDELHPFIERFSREANTIANVDLSESLNKFLHSRLLAFCLCLLNCPNDQFSQSTISLLGVAMENFVLIVINASNDGPLSCERMVRVIIEEMVEAGEFPLPAVHLVIGHLRNYMARVQRERAEERFDHWLVNRDSAEYINRQRLRRNRLEARRSNSNAEEIDTFVTPRSSPDPMDAESGMITIHEQVAEEPRSTERSSGDSLIPPSMRANDLSFPRELLVSNTSRTEVSGRQGPWHAHLPRDWVAIVDRDAERQANQPSQPPFSDGYLSMQPAKRRRVVSANKPSGDLSSVIAETIRDAISASGVNPVSSVNTVVNEASGSASLARAMEAETRRIASENMSNSASDCEKFPNFSEFAKK